jgi:hypothetical protein
MLPAHPVATNILKHNVQKLFKATDLMASLWVKHGIRLVDGHNIACSEVKVVFMYSKDFHSF